MAEKIEAFTVKGKSLRGSRRYKDFCDGNIWRLTKGVDFDSVAAVRCGVSQAAYRLGMATQTRYDKATGVLEIQCVPKT